MVEDETQTVAGAEDCSAGVLLTAVFQQRMRSCSDPVMQMTAQLDSAFVQCSGPSARTPAAVITQHSI